MVIKPQNQKIMTVSHILKRAHNNESQGIPTPAPMTTNHHLLPAPPHKSSLRRSLGRGGKWTSLTSWGLWCSCGIYSPPPPKSSEGGEYKRPMCIYEQCEQERKLDSCSPAGCCLSVVKESLGKPGVSSGIGM